jgi:hypothetical protein
VTSIEKMALGLGVAAIVCMALVVTAGILRELWRERREPPEPPKPLVVKHYGGIPVIADDRVPRGRVLMLSAVLEPAARERILNEITFAGEHPDQFPQRTWQMPYDWWKDRGLRGGPRV